MKRNVSKEAVIQFINDAPLEALVELQTAVVERLRAHDTARRHARQVADSAAFSAAFSKRSVEEAPKTGCDANGNTRLLICVTHGSLDDVKAALKDGADVNQANSRSGWTPLMAAAQYGKLDVGLLLLKQKGINLDAQDSVDKSTALHHLGATISPRDAEDRKKLMQAMLHGGANPTLRNSQNIMDQRGCTPDHVLEVKGYSDMAQELKSAMQKWQAEHTPSPTAAP